MPVSRQYLVRFSALTLAALLFADLPTMCQAGLVVTVESSTVAAGGTGSFDVVLASTGGSYQVGGFSIDLSLPTASGTVFNSVDINTTDSYLFATLQSSPFSFTTFPASELIASDAYNSPPYYTTVDPGSTFALAHVTYSVDANIVGPIPVSIEGIGITTQILDADGDIIPFQAINGNIIIVTSVPEPSSAVVYGIGIVCLALYGKTSGCAGTCAGAVWAARTIPIRNHLERNPVNSFRTASFIKSIWPVHSLRLKIPLRTIKQTEAVILELRNREKTSAQVGFRRCRPLPDLRVPHPGPVATRIGLPRR